MGKYAQDICRHRFRWIFAQFGWQAQINTRHKYKTLNHAPVYILQFANLGGLKQVTSDVDLLHKSIWLILLMSMDWPTDCQLKCQISIWAMLPRDRHQVGRFRFGSWYLCCLFFLLHRCTNTQMAVDDNLIGFSSLTLPTTSTDKANLVQLFCTWSHLSCCDDDNHKVFHNILHPHHRQSKSNSFDLQNNFFLKKS